MRSRSGVRRQLKRQRASVYSRNTPTRPPSTPNTMATIRPRSLPLRWCGRGRSVLGTGPSPWGCRVRVVAAAAGDAVADGWCTTLGLKSDGVPECGCRVRDADCEREVVLERDELALTAGESERAALWELDDRLLLTSEREMLSCAATHLKERNSSCVRADDDLRGVGDGTVGAHRRSTQRMPITKTMARMCEKRMEGAGGRALVDDYEGVWARGPLCILHRPGAAEGTSRGSKWPSSRGRRRQPCSPKAAAGRRPGYKCLFSILGLQGRILPARYSAAAVNARACMKHD